jgi:hypothetical protein
MRHGERLNLRLSRTLAAALRELANEDGVPPSTWLRRAIAAAAGLPAEDAEPMAAPGHRPAAPDDEVPYADRPRPPAEPWTIT